MKIKIIFYVIFNIFRDCISEEFQKNIDDYYIYTNITNNYNKNVRPENKVDFVAFFSLKQMVSIDEKSQIMTTNSYVALFWNDKRLKWNPSDYNGITYTLIPASQLWMMDFFVINTADTNGYVPIPAQTLAYVNNDGYVYSVFSLTSLKTRCRMDVKYYPFDSQNCSVRIIAIFSL